MEKTMDITDGTINYNLIQAIRVAYRVAWLLPAEEAAAHLRFIGRAWKDGDRAAVLTGLGAVKFALGNTVGVYEQFAELRAAITRI